MEVLEGESEVDPEGYFGFGVLLLFFIFGVVAHSPVLVLYFRSKYIRSITDKFLVNLLIADVVSLILLFPSIATSFMESLGYFTEDQTGPMEFSLWPCRARNGITASVAVASILAALEIAAERYLAVVKPLHYHKLLTPTSILITSLIGNAVAIVVGIITTFETSYSIFPSCGPLSHINQGILKEPVSNVWDAHDTGVNNYGQEDSLLWGFFNFNSSHEQNYKSDLKIRMAFPRLTNPDILWPLFSLATAIFLFMLPLTLMLIFYAKIWIEARRQKIKIAKQYKPYFLPIPMEHVGPGGVKVKGSFLPIVVKLKLIHRLRATQPDRAGRVAVVAIMVTILCWGPYYVLRIIRAINEIMTLYDSSHSFNESLSCWILKSSVPVLLAALHPVLCPLFYSYRYKKVRTEVGKVISTASLLKKNRNMKRDKASGSNFNSLSLNGSQCIRQAIIARPFQKEETTEACSTESAESTLTSSLASTTDVEVLDKEMGHVIAGAPNICVQLCEDNNSVYRNEVVQNDAQSVTQEGMSPNNFLTGKVARVGNFLNYLNLWVNSYSRRWLQHRESVTSTASFITLLSNKHQNKTVANV